MYKKSVIVPEGTFRSKLPGIAATLFAAASLTGLLSILSVFLPGNRSLFLETAAPSGIKAALEVLHGLLTKAPVDKQVTLTFAVLLGVTVLFGTVFSSALSVGIFQMQRGKYAHGALLIARGTKLLFYATTAVGISAAVVFVIRLTYYIVLYLSDGIDGIMLLLPGTATELVLGVIAALVTLKLRRFFDNAGDCALSISRTLISGILNAPTISTASAVGCLLLGIVSVLLSLGRISTSSAWTAAALPHLCTAMLLLGGAADVLLFLFLRGYKRSSEYLLYKGSPATVRD